MHTLPLGSSTLTVSRVGLGCNNFGRKLERAASRVVIDAALEAGITFFDTADVYGDGHSERLIAQLLRERDEALIVATKFGRRAPEQAVAYYTYESLRGWLERSLANLGVETADLVQLHCPPWDAYYTPSVFEACDRLVEEGLVRAYGVSVEKVEEALKAIEYPGVSTVQIIFNVFRQRPAALFFEQARSRDVGVIVRVPLASGLLTGKYTRESVFAADDHRTFNRHGESFDAGETFSGVDFETGLDVVEELRALVPEGATLAQLALRWILMFDAVSTVIPGAKTPEQALGNAAAADLPPLSDETMRRIAELYDERIAPLVHQRW